jgi:2-phospho-L-lactate guanylyltransferase
MKAILIPVKVFAASKQRLAPYYSSQARAELAAALCHDFFGVVARARGFDRVFVVSQEVRALIWAKERGWQTIPEDKQVSESHSVDAASQFCGEAGVRLLLRLPIDIPLATAENIEAVFAAAETSPCVVIVPSRDDTGTNALLRSPPTLFPSHFGPGSFALHLQEAGRCEAQVKVLNNARIASDIDEIDDLRAVADQLSPYSATGRWLAKHGLPE